MTSISVEYDLGFFIFIGIFLLLALLGFWMCLYMKLEVMHTQINDHIYYTYHPRDCFEHSDYHPYCEHESGLIHTEEGDMYVVPDDDCSCED